MIDLGLEDATEPEALEEGEYRVRVTNSELTESQAGNRMLVLTLEPVNYPDAQLIREYMVFPSEDDNARVTNSKKLSIKRACDALGVGYEFEPEEFIGKEAIALLSYEDDPEYGEQNRVRRFQTGA